MTTPVSPTPFVIRPPDNLLETYPQIRRASLELALAYAFQKLVDEEHLQAMGLMLWQALAIDGDLAEAQRQAGTVVLPLIVESNIAAVQQLPWETLYHPEQGFLGKTDGFTLLRGLPERTVSVRPPESGPLRVLLFTALPDDLDAENSRLDVEEEQAQVLEALTPLIKKGVVALEMPDDGRFATLKTLLREFQPHLVFLSGHGKFVEQPGQTEPPFAVFQFENDEGKSDFVREETIAAAFKGTGVRCVVLSACESGKGSSVALNQGLTWRLAELGVPHVLGMRESVLDRAGTLFVRELCDQLVKGEAVDVALQRGRQAITRPLANSPWLKADNTGMAEISLGQWCLPMLISHERDAPLINWDFAAQPLPEREANLMLSTVSLPPRFLGRRSELRELKSRLRQQTARRLLIIGPGGQGKTALAGRLAQDLERQGYEVLAYSARPQNPWAEFVFELEYLLTPANADRYDRQRARFSDAADQARLLLRLLLGQFNNRVVLFFDNLESVQDPKSRTISDGTIQAWLDVAQGWVERGLILLVTSRWEIPGWPEADVCHLTHANYGDFLQMARPVLPLTFLERRDRLRQVYKTLHGNGRGIQFFAAAIQGMDVSAEEAFLEQLRTASEELQTNMAIAEIVRQLEPEAEQLLHRLPVYQTPVPIEGIVTVALDVPEPRALLQRLVAVSLVELVEAPEWQTVEYQLSPLVGEWLRRQGVAEPETVLWQRAAHFLAYLFAHERRNLPQAVAVHQAMHRAGMTGEAHRFALDWIVGPLNRQGLYQTLLSEWLPPICQADDLKIRAEALGQTGKQHHHLGNFGLALPFFEVSLKIWQEIGDKAGEGATLNNISQIFKARGDYETALAYLERSLKIRQEIGDKAGEGTTLNNMSAIAHARGDYETALAYLERSLKICQEIGDVAGLCATLFNMGHIHAQNNEIQEAVGAWVTVYLLARPRGLAQALQALANLAPSLGLPPGLEGWEMLAQRMNRQE